MLNNRALRRRIKRLEQPDKKPGDRFPRAIKIETIRDVIVKHDPANVVKKLLPLVFASQGRTEPEQSKPGAETRVSPKPTKPRYDFSRYTWPELHSHGRRHLSPEERFAVEAEMDERAVKMRNPPFVEDAEALQKRLRAEYEAGAVHTSFVSRRYDGELN